jgi:hypothetical protein
MLSRSKLRQLKYISTATLLACLTIRGEAARTDVYSDVKRMRISDAPEDDRLLGKLITHENKTYYIVDVDENLGFIASKLYGTIKFVPKIKKWNKKTDEHKIQAGQLLLLEEPPQFTSYETQSEQLLNQLALKFDLDKNWYKKKNQEGVEIAKLVTFRSGADAAQAGKQPTVARKENARERRAKLRNRRQPESKVPRAKDTVSPITPPAEKVDSPDLIALVAVAKLFNADKLGEIGSKLYEEKNFRTAKLFLQAARKKNQKHFQSWLQELFIQKMCGSEQGLSSLKDELKNSSMEEQVRSQLLGIVDGQKESSCKAIDSEPSLKTLSVPVLVEAAEILQSNQDCNNSLLFAKEARKKQPAEVKPWIVEITCLKSMGQKDEAKVSVSQFVEIHPGMSQLPFLKVE